MIDRFTEEVTQVGIKDKGVAGKVEGRWMKRVVNGYMAWLEVEITSGVL